MTPDPQAPPGSTTGSQRRAVRAVFVLLALLALALGLRSTGSEPAPVEVRSADLVGRSADDATARLTADGLVARLAYDGRGAGVGTVASVEPVGDLPAGSTVLLHVVPEGAAR